MNNNYPQIQELLHQKADYQARLNLLPYDGTPEVKEDGGKMYLYVRKRIGSRLSSTYVDVYSDTLYQLLLRNARDAKEYRKNIRRLDKSNIYDQAILEGVTTSFPQTEDIIDNGIVNGMTATDVQKILNLKHAWEFILDRDVITYPSDYSILCHIAKLVNEGFFQDGGRIRGIPVTIGGSSYVPPMPIETVIKEHLEDILKCDLPADEKAIQLCLYCMKTQIFNDGNKRASVIFANHYLISQGGGMLIIPEKEVPEFKRLLVAFYEDRSNDIFLFMKERCVKTF